MSKKYKKSPKRNPTFDYPQILALLKEIPLTDRRVHQVSRMIPLSKISFMMEEAQVNIFSFSYHYYISCFNS